ncbi:aldo/keto reductase [Treponema parvum]|uniref:Aldo/keto reductase n=2 Tax=Treponema parvum TaxID=138851 RepID=A0A975IFN8_9SPIR|nr:aldo/keto reductase [Treponema parvum]
MNFKSITDKYRLSDGNEIPCIGFGTWQSKDGEECYNAVLAALECGYRHIDTAAAYGNEASVGKAISEFLKHGKCKREDLYIATKLHNNDHGYEEAKAAIEKSLKDLNLEYLDLYLIHWPNPIKTRSVWQKANAGAYKAMEEAVREGKIRSLGISNFRQHHIEELLKTAEIKPVINQIKLCPGITQPETVSYSRSQGMLLEAYSPMGTGLVLENAQMKKIADEHKTSVAQVCVRWCLQQGFLPLPKSVKADRIRQNADVFSFELTEKECSLIGTLKDTGIVPVRDPDTTQF